MSGSGGGPKGYIPIQVNMPPGVGDQYGIGVTTTIGTSGSRPPVSMTTGMGVSANGVPSSGRRVPMKKFEPREAVSVSNRATSDLADFFKNSAPPGGGFAGPGGAAGGSVGGSGSGEDPRYRRKKASFA